MQKSDLSEELLVVARHALGMSDMFACLQDDQLDSLIELAGEIHVYYDQEVVISSGSAPDYFLVILQGEVSVVVCEYENLMEIARLAHGNLVGEMAMIRGEAHSYSYCANGELTALCFTADMFYEKLLLIPGINLPMMRFVSGSMHQTSYQFFLENKKDPPLPDFALMKLLPVDFMKQHRLIPVKRMENLLLVGYTDVINQELLDSIARLLPDLEIKSINIDREYYDQVMMNFLRGSQKSAAIKASEINPVDELLRRLVLEGGSDLHLSAGQKPRWRIDGEIFEVSDSPVLASEEVLELLKPIARPEILASFADICDEDFAYSMGDSCRFRINVLRDHHGVSAVFRYIPSDIRSFDDLGLPTILTKFCAQPKGLVLVTGPTGCGKSTTLAAMLDWINQRNKCHILTIEDPIEFIHTSNKALVNQREVGIHTKSFANALRAGLRENPDVVMVGEIRDNETMAMVMETANTGHLVFATLHTATAPSTIDRVIDNFPHEEQNQVRMFLAESLIGVVCQTLCRRIGGGSVAAFEIMVMDPAMSNLIRTSKTFMLPNAMISAHGNGNSLLNDDLLRLVHSGIISGEEALSKTRDKPELEKKMAVSGHASGKKS